MTDKTAPVDLSERIRSIDVLRGFAVLGILIMNIQDYAMIGAAYFNPSAHGDLTGANWLVWFLSHIFADQKFMTLFSLLFGAGVILFTTRVEARGISAAGPHYRRTLWLFVFGLLHGYCIWCGDILFAYALCALLVYLVRRAEPWALLIVGLAGLAVCSGLYLMAGFSMPEWPQEQVTAMSQEMWSPTAEQIVAETSAYTGSWLDQMTERVPCIISVHTQAFPFYFLWRAGGLMLIGMALYKWGILSAQRSTRFYLLMLVIGYGVGIPLIVHGANRHVANGWSFEYSFFLGSQYNYWGSLFVAAAHLGVVMLLIRHLRNQTLLAPFSAAGRMAFTNYIMQSVICTFIFYGHGFGLYGTVERTGQALIVLAIWIFQLALSSIWLKRFRFGPLEWCWRSLTYWKPQPMRKL